MSRMRAQCDPRASGESCTLYQRLVPLRRRFAERLESVLALSRTPSCYCGKFWVLSWRRHRVLCLPESYGVAPSDAVIDITRLVLDPEAMQIVAIVAEPGFWLARPNNSRLSRPTHQNRAEWFISTRWATRGTR